MGRHRLRPLALTLALLLTAPAAAQQHRGGTMRLLATSAAGSIDPHINYTAQFWQVFAPVYDGLVAFRKAPGPPEIVPDLAEAIPTPEDGLTYRFRLRENLRFSDGTPLGPNDVVASFKRIYRVGSPTQDTFYGNIQGARACIATPTRCDLPGVQASGNDITITLTTPDPEFLQKLALPHASILPATAPPHDTGTIPIPGTGPWRIAAYDPNEALTLERNPHFHPWNPDAQPDAYADAVRYEFGLSGEAQVTAILNSQADWIFDIPPPDRLPELAAHPALLHLNPADALWFVPLNTRIPPFDDPRARRAFAMAIDRRVAVRLMGGRGMATPLCQSVPPGLPGHTPYCPHPHDPAAARRLVAQSNTAGQQVTLVTDDGALSRALGTYLIEVLEDLGYRARLQTLSPAIQFTYIQNTNNRVQASLTGWYADYPSARTILAANFGCAAFRPGSDSSTNIPGFCDPALDALLATNTPEATAAFDRAVTDQAAAITLFSPRAIDVTAPRLGNFVFHEVYRFLLQLAWVQ